MLKDMKQPELNLSEYAHDARAVNDTHIGVSLSNSNGSQWYGQRKRA